MFKEQVTVLFRQNYNANASIIVNQGGSNSGKTYAIMQVLFCRACEAMQQVITVVGQDIPNLKSGVLRDALKIYRSSDILQHAIESYNKTDRTFEFHNGSAKHIGANHQQGKSLINKIGSVILPAPRLGLNRCNHKIIFLIIE